METTVCIIQPGRVNSRKFRWRRAKSPRLALKRVFTRSSQFVPSNSVWVQGAGCRHELTDYQGLIFPPPSHPLAENVESLIRVDGAVYAAVAYFPSSQARQYRWINAGIINSPPVFTPPIPRRRSWQGQGSPREFSATSARSCRCSGILGTIKFLEKWHTFGVEYWKFKFEGF